MRVKEIEKKNTFKHFDLNIMVKKYPSNDKNKRISKSPLKYNCFIR